MKRRVFWGDDEVTKKGRNESCGNLFRWGDEIVEESSDKPHNGKYMKIAEEENIYATGTQIHFTGEINSATIEKLIKVFTKVISDNKSRSIGIKAVDKNGKVSFKEVEELNIEYIIDSPGGSVTDVLKFVDFIDIVRSKYPHIVLTSIITGLVASAGTTMAVIADRRYMTSNAFAMVHELSSGSGGKYTQLMSYANFIEKMHKKLVDIYVKYTPLSVSDIESLLQKETWFIAEEYKKLGFVDEIRPATNVVAKKS